MLSKRGKDIVTVLALVALCLLLYFVNPTEATLYRCPVYYSLGIKCPGCGSLRAMHYLLHGDFPTAVHYNLMVPVLLLLLMGGWLATRRESLARWMNNLYNTQLFRFAVVFLLVGWMFLRNIINL